ncbi:hypothetical protein N658DRAFT_94963 [Parathielavia hyrcaniae]|uniref:NWD NACHT-NTPase N-terminal domain-containing protein n=1 Tax=Parathielavia hyrcaniae TaxID=113614 RepID=A0AAN6SWC8_9PEZI|nr:hypothetical protein N658DRAFT_94963 [Parathielavia hyrcaniae]
MSRAMNGFRSPLQCSAAIQELSIPKHSATHAVWRVCEAMPGGQQPDAEGAAPAPASHWTRAYASYLRGGKADKTAPTDRDARDRLAKVVEILQRDAGIQQQQAAAAAPPADASADDIAAHVVGVVTASLREPLRKRVDDLERRRWRVPPALALGGGDVLVADVVRRCAQFVVLAKDFVGSAVGSASPEGGLAWAGVCFAVQFIENPIKGQETLLEGFEAVTELLHRFAAVEQSEAVRDPNGLLSKCLVQLYVAIIDFQARAIVHLDHRFARRVLSDTFKKDQWKDLIDTIKERKSLCNDALDDSLREQVDKRSEELKVLLDKQHNDVIAQLTNLEV